MTLRIAIAVLLFAAYIVPTVAEAHTFSETRTLLVGNPNAKISRGLTETLVPCNTSSPLNGLDGYWFSISGYGTDPRHEATLTVAATLDGDLAFYDSSCNRISAGVGSCAQELVGTTEECEVPTTSAFVVVNAAAGAGSFTLAMS